jgi:FkbM family methyltransferase
MNGRLKRAIRQLLPRSIGRHTIKSGPLRGSTIVTSWHDYPGAIMGSTERALLECFATNVNKGETWLDIGAHYGYTAIALCKLVGPSGRVFAFEPMLSTSGCICSTRSLNNLAHLTVIPTALGNCPDVEMNSLQSSRGMIDSTLQGCEGFKETFVVSRLDWLWPRISGTDLRIDGVKIDVQGMELQVLEGMAALAKRYQPKLLIELHKGVSRSKLLDLIASIGYEPCGSAVEPLPGETEPLYADDRTYMFAVDKVNSNAHGPESTLSTCRD